MREDFIPLAQWLKSEPVNTAPVEIAAVETVDEPMPEPQALVDEAIDDGIDDAFGAVRRFRAALDDALDASLAALLAEVAIDVVGRELQLGGAAIAQIVARARERYALEEPIVVRVHPDDVAALDVDVNVVGDARLRRGDVALDVRTGTIDATLGTRLERLLRNVAR